MELIFYAPVWGQSGYEQLSRGLILALDQMGVQIELRPSRDWNNERIGLPQETVARLARITRQRVSPLAPHVLHQVPKGQPVHPNAPVICYTLFESDRAPKPWIDGLMGMDRVLVFSEFNREAWSRTGIPPQKIGRLPVAIDSFVYSPEGPRMEIENAKGYVFLTSGDYTERKNFEALIEAYVKEFNSADEVTLVVKAHFGGFTRRFRRDCAERLRQAVRMFNPANPPRVLFWGEKVTDHAMASLYRRADCFALATRGEGLGMQFLEAAATGLPIIHTGWSAQADFLGNSNSFPVKYRLDWMDDPQYVVKCPQSLNSKWAQVDIADLRRALRHVYENREKARKKGLNAMEWARKQTWQAMAVAFISEVVNLYNPASAPRSYIKEKIEEAVPA